MARDCKCLSTTQGSGIVVQFDEIVVGSSVEALLYAFTEQLPVFYTTPQRPFRFDYLAPDVDLSCLKIDVESISLNTFDGEKRAGIPSRLLWERLSFLLSLTGQQPLSNLAKGVRFDGEDQLTFADAYSRLIDIKFNKCFYFGDESFTEFNVDSGDIICYDWVAFNRGGKHAIDYIETDDDFVKEIWFYSSDRIDGKTEVKDACAVSYLSKEQVANFDYSETMARFKVVSEMEARGMKGKFNGFGPNGKPKHYKFRTSYIARRMAPANRKIRSTFDKIEIKECCEDSLLEGLPTSAEKYTKILKYL